MELWPRYGYVMVFIWVACGCFTGCLGGMGFGLARGDGNVGVGRDAAFGFVKLLCITNLLRKMPIICTARSTEETNVARRTICHVDKYVASTGNRPVVKTGILIGKTTANAMAGVSNRCTLGMSANSVLVVSCVKCVRRRVGLGKRGRLGVILRRSDRVLGRIIVIKCNARGGMGLAKTIRRIAARIFSGHSMPGIARTLRKSVPGLGVGLASKGPAHSTDCGMHNAASVKRKNGTLMLVSNIRNSPSVLGPGSVTDMSMLGSTTSTSVCKTQKAFKMILVAAGRPVGSGASVACANGFSIRHPIAIPSFIASKCRCTDRFCRTCRT